MNPGFLRARLRRAKCYEQLGEADSAFEDAQYIVREFDGDPVSPPQAPDEDQEQGEDKSSSAASVKSTPKPPREPSDDSERKILREARLLGSRVESKAAEMRKEKTEKVVGPLKVGWLAGLRA